MYIIDVGRSMGEKHHGRKESDLEWAMHYVWDKITSTVLPAESFPRRRTFSLIDLGSNWEEDGYCWSRRAPDRWYEGRHGVVVAAADTAQGPEMSSAMRTTMRTSQYYKR